jgi:hypothetical protein
MRFVLVPSAEYMSAEYMSAEYMSAEYMLASQRHQTSLYNETD